MGRATTTSTSVTVEGVAPDAAYALVSDVTRTGEWSPENLGGRWVGGADGPAVGARFVGRNKRERARWTTTCTVVAADPGARFAFDVDAVVFPVARWDWTFAPDGDGTRVTLTWTDRRDGVRGLLLRSLAPLVIGHGSTEANITESLANLRGLLAAR